MSPVVAAACRGDAALIARRAFLETKGALLQRVVSSVIVLVGMVTLCSLGGCSRPARGVLDRAKALKASDIKSVFSKKEEVRVGRNSRPGGMERVVGPKKVALGYIQERWYPVRGDASASEARIYVVYDSHWYRRGLITEDGAGHMYDSEGRAVRLSGVSFLDNVKTMLGTRETVTLEGYKIEKRTGSPAPEVKPEKPASDKDA